MAELLDFRASNKTDDEVLQDISKESAKGKIELILYGRKLDRKFLMRLPFSRIETLDLSNCQLDDGAIGSLTLRMNSNLPLQTLNLSMNNFSVGGAKALAAVLPKLTALENLNLANTQLGDEGVRAIVTSLKDKSLTYLNLSFLEISDNETANAITKLKVKNLELVGSKFFEEDKRAISSAIKEQEGNLAISTSFNPEDVSDKPAETSSVKKAPHSSFYKEPPSDKNKSLNGNGHSNSAFDRSEFLVESGDDYPSP